MAQDPRDQDGRASTSFTPSGWKKKQSGGQKHDQSKALATGLCDWCHTLTHLREREEESEFKTN